ncbi:hypothetical protein DY000_02016966 [Brassica cretica]|uniref:Uncharacterized protein n=1 Tax=Brassica cretica TaxID=69181 RepID=A0ABQ7DC13_BRACR|nr:hypothetical protein DY000_02016966 [Brassica cretica]
MLKSILQNLSHARLSLGFLTARKQRLQSQLGIPSDRRRSKSHVPAGNKTRKKSRPTRSKLSSKTVTHRAMPSEAEEGEVSGEACEDPIAPASLKEVLPGDSSPVSKSADHPALGKEGCSHNLAEDMMLFMENLI